MKTTTISTNGIFNFGNYFVLNSVDSTLKEIQLATAKVEPGVTTYYDREGNISLVCKDGERVRLYKTSEDYRNGCEVDNMDNFVGNTICVDGVRYTAQYSAEDGVYATGYIFEDGEPKAKAVRFASLYRKNKYHIDGTFSTEHQVYPDRKTCLGFNPVTEKDLDGTERIIGGELAALALTDKQEALICKLESLINECVANGITVAYDYCECEMIAFNGEKYEISNDDDCDESTAIKEPNMGLRTLKARVEYYNSDDYYCLDKK